MPLGQRQVDQRLALDLEHVEGRRARRRPDPCCIAEKLARPCSSSAHDLAVEDAVRRLHRPHDRACDRRKRASTTSRSGSQLDLAAARSSRSRGSRPTSPREPALAARHRVGKRRQHRRVGAPVSAASCSFFFTSSQFFGSPPSLAGTSVHGPFSRSPCRWTVRPPFGFSSTSSYVPLVPDLDRAGAVVARRDLALERRVRERVILDVDGEMLRPRLERHALGDGPAGEHAVALEPEVVVEPAGVVALDDEDRAPCRACPSRTARASSRASACARSPSARPQVHSYRLRRFDESQNGDRAGAQPHRRAPSSPPKAGVSWGRHCRPQHV